MMGIIACLWQLSQLKIPIHIPYKLSSSSENPSLHDRSFLKVNKINTSNYHRHIDKVQNFVCNIFGLDPPSLNFYFITFILFNMFMLNNWGFFTSFKTITIGKWNKQFLTQITNTGGENSTSQRILSSHMKLDLLL